MVARATARREETPHPGGADGATPPPDAGDAPFPFVRCEAPGAPLPPLIEDRRVYDQDSLDLLTVHLTVADLAGLAAVNGGTVDAEVPVVFEEGAATGGPLAPNATLEIRGAASRRNAQKNYKINLTVPGSLWRGQREINLNKHMWDLTRVRNKLSFDLFRTIPHLTSLRTQFVQLFVNGESYGLYTWIEEADKRFLASHGLDPSGQLYKASGFEFQPLTPELVADPVELALRVEDKATPDHAKLVRMLDALHAEDADIDAVIDRHFDRDNLVTWLAVNVLLNNIDTTTQNYYLYSPSSCEGWYVLPWDYDGAWGFYAQRGPDIRERWQYGLANWWISDLFKRFYARPANVQAVSDRIEELAATVLTDPITASHLDRYRELVRPHIGVMPDLEHLPGQHDGHTPEHGVLLWADEYARIASTVSRFHAEHLAVLERPMPVFTDVELSSPLEFHWGHSFDLQGDPLSYDFQISTSTTFEPATLVDEQLGLVANDTLAPVLAPGTYYWRVVIQDHKSADSWQLPMDPYEELVIP